MLIEFAYLEKQANENLFADVNAALAVAFELGGNVIFDLGNGDSATINGITEAQLSDDILV